MSGLPADSRIRSGSVLMNSPTICSMPAISGGRPATVTPNTTSSRPLSRPSSIPHAAWIRVLSVSPCRRPCSLSRVVKRLAQQMRDLLGRDRRPGAIRRRKPRALVQPGQCLPPGRQRGSAILAGDPRQIVPVRRHPRQRARIPVLRIEREQLPHQHRHRPAVHQQVMVGQHQPMLIGRQPDQRKPNERRRSHIEALGAVLRQDAGQPLLAVACVQQRQVDAAPGRWRSRHDHLHRPAQPLVPERRPQAGMALDQRLRRRFERRPRPAALAAPAPVAPYRRPAPAHHKAHGTAAPPAAATAAGCPRAAGIGSPGPRSRPATAPPAAGRSACGRRHRAARHGAPAPPAPGTSAAPDRGPLLH